MLSYHLISATATEIAKITFLAQRGTCAMLRLPQTYRGHELQRRRVRVNMKVDNIDVGWVQYEHLETNIALQPIHLDDYLPGIGSSIIRLPGSTVGPLHQGEQMACQYENRVVATGGSHYYLEDGRSHKILTARHNILHHWQKSPSGRR